MTSIDQHLENVRTRLLATGIAPSRLAVMAGLGNNGLVRLKHPDWRCSVKTLRLVETLLGRLELDGSAAVVHAPNITDVSLDVCAENHSGAPRCGAATSEPQ